MTQATGNVRSVEFEVDSTEGRVSFSVRLRNTAAASAAERQTALSCRAFPGHQLEEIPGVQEEFVQPVAQALLDSNLPFECLFVNASNIQLSGFGIIREGLVAELILEATAHPGQAAFC